MGGNLVNRQYQRFYSYPVKGHQRFGRGYYVLSLELKVPCGLRPLLTQLPPSKPSPEVSRVQGSSLCNVADHICSPFAP
jgi:hypothetical protein